MEVTLSQPRTFLKTQINSEEITKEKQLNKSKRKASKPCTHGRTSSNTNCPHLQNRRQEVGERLTLRKSAGGKDTAKKDPTRTKTKEIHRANRNHNPRSVRAGDQGDYKQNLTRILPQKFTPNTEGVRTEQLKKKRLTGRVSQTMGRQRNNPQMKGKGEVSETMLNEKEASQLSDSCSRNWL